MGVLGGITGLAGILVTIWCGLRGWPKDVQHGVSAGGGRDLFDERGVDRRKGAITPETIKSCLRSGCRRYWPHMARPELYGRIDEATFRKIVLALLFVSGAGVADLAGLGFSCGQVSTSMVTWLRPCRPLRRRL